MGKGPERQSAQFLFSQRPPSVFRINEKTAPIGKLPGTAQKSFFLPNAITSLLFNREITGIP
jgi:hypothetical protein